MKRLIPVVIALALIAAIVYFVFYPEYQERYEYSEERANLMDYFKLTDESQVAIILQDEMISEQARYWDGAYYFDLATVHKYFNARFYHDEREKLLLYSLPDDTVRVRIGGKTIETKQGQTGRSYPVARYEDGILYISADLVKAYTNFSYEGWQNPGRMQVYTEWGDIQAAKVNRDIAVRYRGGVKSEILTEIVNGSKVTVLEQMETWAKVKTADGFIGYVELRRLANVYSERLVPVTDYVEPEFASQTRPYKICLGWHYIGGPAGNDTIYEVTRNTEGLNVISPPWFFLTDNEGNFTNFASSAYVKTAHDMGLEVWALVENITYKNDLNMYELLSATSKRTALIDNLMTAAVEAGIDGINVDFEELSPDEGPHFVQFVRELSIRCREQGLVLSVDNYVPFNFNEYYNRAEQGVFADYVIIMGYDEHYGGSEKAGSVASIEFVEGGILRTVEQVPAEKVINGVPFYTRIWETQGVTVTSQAVGMALAQDWVANRNLTPEWDDEACQNYVEYRASDGTLHQVWLEDAESLRVKFNVMDANNVGGVAFWQLGQETAEVWEVVLDYVGN
ncbi:MAG: SH3 domain-containing protein [Lachnospiraceae bacterium]|jgi:spore germination protein YaaH|nr:SH3 domain-containing protein [Lachnospiraceae bacterium]